MAAEKYHADPINWLSEAPAWVDLLSLTKGINTSGDLALAFAAFPFQSDNHFPSNKLTGFVSHTHTKKKISVS